jgi:DNA-binding SARP family transcriptional activator
MRLWQRLGDRTAVVKQYRILSQLLADELATDPMPETQALYAELTEWGLPV